MPGRQSTSLPSIAIVGMGPRGISLVERLAAALRADPARPLSLHLIDDAEIGAGRVWETTQTRTLCMNTLAGAVTLFTEPGATVAAPVFEGPTQYEWVRLVRGERGGISEPKLATFDTHPPDPTVAESFATELADTRPESHPSRALYGAYLRWCYDVALQRLPENVTVHEHHSRVTGIQAEGEHDVLTLADGTTVPAAATVLALGWQRPGPDNEETELAAATAANPELTWVSPGNPVEQPVELLPAGRTVLVRGLGMGFFDLLAQVSIDRGGDFRPDKTARSGLRYVPSGAEPHLVVSSYRGYPYLPKSDFGGLPPKAALTRLRAVIDSLPVHSLGPASIDFDVQVWPAVVRDAYEAYYRVLTRVRPEAVAATPEEILGVIDDVEPVELPRQLARFVPDPQDRLDLSAWERPLDGVVVGRSELTELIAGRMVGDIAAAEAGRDSPLKAALWSISASRKPASILGDNGRYTFESRRNRFATLMAVGQMAGSGPPLFRSRQLLALVDAGLVSFLGAEPKLRVDESAGQFVMKSATTRDSLVYSDTLVDAWMHKPDIRRPADPLARSLVAAGRVRPFHETTTDNQRIATGSPEVDRGSRLLVGTGQQPDPRVHLVGIPTHAQLADTTISPMPGTDPLMLQETDAAAGSALRIALGD